MDLARAYRAIRERLTDLAADLAHREFATTVPATPAWTLRETYAHLAGAAADVVAENLEGAGSEAWTQTQVEARATWSIAAILQEWTEVGPAFEARVADDPDGLWRYVSGTWLHEQDIRGAVGLRGIRDTEGGEVALALVDAIGPRLDRSGAAGLAIRSGTRTWTLGSQPPAATLRSDPYELARAAGGRRSVRQIRAMDWTGSPEPYLPHFATYGPTRVDLVD